MCLIVFSWMHQSHQLLVAANRDEFYQRPTLPAQFWPEQPQLLAGKDLQEGGTWMGITQSGRFSAVTNYRCPDKTAYPHSRGHLTRDFLLSALSPEEYAQRLSNYADQYAGFNLLISDNKSLVYCSNRAQDSFWQSLEPGVYGLSNHLLDTPWPKVKKGKIYLQEAIEKNQSNALIFQKLRDNQIAEDRDLPETGIEKPLEKMLSPLFIATPSYGTRTSTLLKINRDRQIFFEEKTYKPASTRQESTQFLFTMSPSP